MKRTPLARTSITTIARSSASFSVLVASLVAACAHQSPRSTGASTYREAPPPHLRGASAETSVVAQAAHTDPPADPNVNEGVSLGGMLAFADLHSPILSVARSTRSRAEAVRVAASQLLPSNPEFTVAVGPRFGISGTGVDMAMSLMQEIQIGGERGMRMEAADRGAELTDAEIEQLRWFVHCDVHAAFHRSLVEQERVRLAERVVTFQEEVLRVVERQISAGETAPLTLRLAQAEVAQAQQVLVATRQTFLSSRIRLGLLAGWPSANPPMPGGVVDTPREPPPLDRLTTVARENLPSLRVGSARIRAAQAQAEAADRAVWARPSVGVQYQREGNPTDEGPYNTVMGVVSVPIPSFQTNQGPRASARADVTVATAELDAMHLLLDGQIAEARSEVSAAAQRSSAYGTEIIPRFEENLTLLRRSFELGEIDILSLSAGRERFLRIQSDALNAQQDFFVALAGLERVVGVDLWHDDHHESEQHDQENAQ